MCIGVAKVGGVRKVIPFPFSSKCIQLDPRLQLFLSETVNIFALRRVLDISDFTAIYLNSINM